MSETEEASSCSKSTTSQGDPKATIQIQPEKVVDKRRFQCAVCGDRAMGYNFGAIVCESCKSFYRRHAHRRPHFRCSGQQRCPITKFTRRFCAACRLKRCFAVGMRVPVCVADSKRSEQSKWSGEKLVQRRVLVSRLLERIALQRQVPASSECDNGGELQDKEHDEMLVRLATAAGCMQVKNSVQVQQRASRDASCVKLAFSSYVRALRHFSELTELQENELRNLFESHIVAQTNLFALFSVKDDLTGWCTVDCHGVSCENDFAEFLECLARDGVDARPYVQAFRSLAGALRVRFAADWPVVLTVLCLLELCSSLEVDNDSAQSSNSLQLVRLRADCQLFLKRHLVCKHDSFEQLYTFCTLEFPEALEQLIREQKSMLWQLLNRNLDLCCELKSDSLAASIRIAQLFEPVVNELVSSFNFAS